MLSFIRSIWHYPSGYWWKYLHFLCWLSTMFPPDWKPWRSPNPWAADYIMLSTDLLSLQMNKLLRWLRTNVYSPKKILHQTFLVIIKSSQYCLNWSPISDMLNESINNINIPYLVSVWWHQTQSACWLIIFRPGVVQHYDGIRMSCHFGLKGLVFLDLGLEIGGILVTLIGSCLQFLVNPRLQLISISLEVL